ncbi:MAG: TetR/AcrR family transcriptional regulator [Alphaproteobacteria bacterium]|nr:TetR/AcrR family transcriptional regulator [Alphaproteobacteria bacterium]
MNAATAQAYNEDTPDNEQETTKAFVRKGRPRSNKSKNAILKATNSLLLHMSVQELSIEAVAKKAKVGKTTIYRWWPNKTALVMEALVSQPGLHSPLPTPKNNAEAVIMQLEKLIRLLDSKNGDTIAQLFSEAQGNTKSQKIFADRFLSPLIDAIQYSVEQGVKEKEFRASLDMDQATDILCGPIFFRLLSRPHMLNDEFRETYPKEAVRLISA